MSTSDQIRQELERIRKANRGVLNPADVVDFARDPNTALHSRFVWDDSEAAQQYRLVQAREVIRFTITVVENKSTPMYVSLREERNKGVSYMSIEDVLRDSDKTRTMLNQALSEIEGWQRRYETLAELARLRGTIAKELARVRGKKHSKQRRKAETVGG